LICTFCPPHNMNPQTAKFCTLLFVFTAVYWGHISLLALFVGLIVAGTFAG